MSCPCKPTTDYFAIVVLIFSICLFIYLVIVSAYFANLAIGKPPNLTESYALFWVSVIFAIIFMAIIVYSLVRLYFYRTFSYEREETPIM